MLMCLRAQILLSFVALLDYTQAYGIDISCNAGKSQNHVSDTYSSKPAVPDQKGNYSGDIDRYAMGTKKAGAGTRRACWARIGSQRKSIISPSPL